MVMGLFSIVGASTHRTELGWGVLFKACSHDGIKLLVLSAMSHYLVGVCAIIVTFQAVKMAARLLSISGHWDFSMYGIEFTVRSSTRHPSESFKFITTKSI
jgi:hypothetical protein